MPTSTPGFRLLVVDDEATIRFALREYFAAHGWAVTCASSVNEAKARLRELVFDVAILDLRLGADDHDGGLTLAQHVLESHADTRTILLTAYGSKETRADALAMGVDEVLDKPTRLWELCEIASRLAEGGAR